MTTKAIEKQLNDLTQQVILLRSAVISVVGERDPEGEYRPEYVKRLLNLARKKSNGVKFTGAADFMKKIGKAVSYACNPRAELSEICSKASAKRKNKVKPTPGPS